MCDSHLVIFTAPTGSLEEVLYIICPLFKIHLQYKMHYSAYIFDNLIKKKE